MQRRSFIGGVIAASAALPALPSWAQGDPLPSWNDGPAKQSIVDFVTRTTTSGGRDLDAAARAHRHLRQRRHAVDRAADVLPSDLRHGPRQGDGSASSRVAHDRAVPLGAGRRPRRSSPRWARRACSRSWRRPTAASRPRSSGRRCSTGWPRRAIRASSGPIPISSTSRCSSCWPTCAPTSSRPSSSRAAASSSCGRGPSAPTAFRRSRWWARRASRSTSCNRPTSRC